jgi:radical SAM protein with 4Fe4S-binding SPASM domain
MALSDPLAPPLPRELQLEVTGACNLACKMCLVRYRPKLGRRQGAMCFHTFKALVDDVPDLERVVLQGLGEPLLAPDLFQMIEYASARGIRIGFNTNGTLLTRERARRLVELDLDWLHISIDGATAATYEGIRDGSDFERVCRNVAGLTSVMRELGAEKPDLSLVFVAMRRNVHELAALVALAADLGVPRLWVQNLSHSFNDTDPAGAYREIRDYHEREALWAGRDPDVDRAFDQARAAADERGIDLRLPRLEAPPPTPRAEGQPGCHWPFGSAYVTHDGKVQPCCMVMGADRAVLGKVGDDGGFADVWHATPYRDFRARLLTDEPPEVCAGCSLYRRVF